MSYATLPNMIKRFGEQELIQLTDRAEPAIEQVDSVVFDACAARADAHINGYLRATYTVPLATTPNEVATAAEDVTRYYLYGASGAPDYVKDGFDQATSWLKDVQRGTVKLDSALVAVATGAGTVGMAEFNTVTNAFAARF